MMKCSLNINNIIKLFTYDPIQTILNLMQEKKLTQIDVSYYIGINERNTRNYFLGKTKLNKHFLIIISVIIELPMQPTLELFKIAGLEITLLDDDKTIVKLLSSDNENSINMRKESLTKELYILNQSIKKIFEQYALEKITLEEYKIISKSLNEKVIQLENDLKLISVNQHSKHITKKQIESFKKQIKSISKEEINIPLLQTIYKRVDIIKNELKITYFIEGNSLKIRVLFIIYLRIFQ